MFEKITEDIKQAMLRKDKDSLDAFRYLKSMLIENKTSKSPIPEIDVAIRYVKKLKESLESFPEGNAVRLKTEREIEILKVYMPAELSEEAVKTYIKEILTANPAANAGMIMKELTPKIKGQFDGKRANELVKSALGI
jgi:uncharacterized protein YqeY